MNELDFRVVGISFLGWRWRWRWRGE